MASITYGSLFVDEQAAPRRFFKVRTYLDFSFWGPDQGSITAETVVVEPTTDGRRPCPALVGFYCTTVASNGYQYNTPHDTLRKQGFWSDITGWGSEALKTITPDPTNPAYIPAFEYNYPLNNETRVSYYWSYVDPITSALVSYVPGNPWPDWTVYA